MIKDRIQIIKFLQVKLKDKTDLHDREHFGKHDGGLCQVLVEDSGFILVSGVPNQGGLYHEHHYQDIMDSIEQTSTVSRRAWVG